MAFCDAVRSITASLLQYKQGEGGVGGGGKEAVTIMNQQLTMEVMLGGEPVYPSIREKVWGHSQL